MKAALRVSIGAMLLAGCASSGKRFGDVSPGMTSEQVREAMKEAPSRFETVEDTGYASWYWGEDYCVLFKNDKVVAKDTIAEGRSGTAKGVDYKERHAARCLAPGQTAQSDTERSIHIPGIGTVHLPGSG